MLGICRGCARYTDRVWKGIPGKPGVAMCQECTTAWEESGEKQRSDKYATVAEQQLMGSQAQKDVVLGGIVERALVDFLFRIQKERLNAGKQVSA